MVARWKKKNTKKYKCSHLQPSLRLHPSSSPGRNRIATLEWWYLPLPDGLRHAGRSFGNVMPTYTGQKDAITYLMLYWWCTAPGNLSEIRYPMAMAFPFSPLDPTRPGAVGRTESIPNLHRMGFRLGSLKRIDVNSFYSPEERKTEWCQTCLLTPIPGFVFSSQRYSHLYGATCALAEWGQTVVGVLNKATIP